MIGEWIDHITSWLSPTTAARRSHARQVYHRNRRSYEGAKTDRLNSNWRPENRSPDAELLGDANKIRARARDLVRSNAYAKGIINALLRNVVGCGIVPQARVTNDAGEPVERLNDALDGLFDHWARVADAGGRLTFWEIQRLAYREVIEAGECLVHFVQIEDDRSRPLSLALELIDADRFADDYLTTTRIAVGNGNQLRRGVEVDPLGRPVAYWLYPAHPQDLASIYIQPVRYPASEFIHLYKCDRIGQTRGISLFAPLISWLKNLGYYVDNELQASAVASCFTAAITTLAGPADGGLLSSDDSSSSDADANSMEYLQPGMIARLMPGEKIESVDPSRPNSQAEAWINLMLRSMAVGSGLSYERMAKDYSKTNYSSARASDLEDRKEFRADQEWLEYHLIGPVWRRFVEMATLEDSERPATDQKLQLSPTQLISAYERFTAHAYQPTGWEWVDPVKEAESSQLALAMNLTTLADEAGAKGKDWIDILRQRKREKDMMASLGLDDMQADATPDESAENDTQETEDAQTQGAAAG